MTHLAGYIRMTSYLNRDDALFLAYHKPYTAVSKSSISRWIKEVLFLAGIDTSVYGAHSTINGAHRKTPPPPTQNLQLSLRNESYQLLPNSFKVNIVST